ncbi:uncharacterized protein LOC144700769 [Wolffia australiana]
MASTLTTLGDKLEETQGVEKIIRSVPQCFRQIVVAITMLLDVSTLTIADLTGRLKAVEDAFEETPSAMHHEGKLYLTEEEWDARRKKRDAENKPGGGGSSNAARRGRRRSNDECRKCGKLGHWARECRSKSKNEQAHVVQEEEGASLFFVESTPVILTSPAPTSTPRSSTASPKIEEKRPDAPTQIQLWEEKVFAHLGDEEKRDEETWVLDTGSTNHMSGSHMAFTELEVAVLGSVRFGDDSVAQIEGRGTIMFQCKNGEHGSFRGVYFIPRLTMNIISVGQLDEAGYRVDIEKGAMKIHEPGGQLLAKVMRRENRLYILGGEVDEETWRWHARFGHVNIVALRKMAQEELVRGLPEVSRVDQLCEASRRQTKVVVVS